ncbi:MAG: hypothetical protein IKF14_10490 [Atopobiaceae bacterium]|nr:hypothetical protein [Atopobiaceae bacterium]
MAEVSVDEMAEAIGAIVTAWGTEQVGALFDAMEQAGLYARDKAEQAAPGRGRYAGAWGIDARRTSKTSFTVTVGNSAGRRLSGRGSSEHPKRYPTNITSLLEKGHMARGGGWVAAREHIDPAYEYALAYLKARLGSV